MFEEHKIKGGAVVKPPPEKKKKRKHFPGHQLFNMPTFTSAIIAGSMSGKTTLLDWMIRNHLCPPKKKDAYKILLFSAMIHRDPKWQGILKYLQDTGYETFFDNDYEQLEKEYSKIQNDEYEWPFEKFIIFSDDMGADNRKPIISTLTKAGRHAIMTFLCVHDAFDLNKDARKNIHIWMLLRGLSDDVLKSVYECAKPNLTEQQFIDLYRQTQKNGEYNFLYFDKINNEFRKNFDVRLHIQGQLTRN